MDFNRIFYIGIQRVSDCVTGVSGILCLCKGTQAESAYAESAQESTLRGLRRSRPPKERVRPVAAATEVKCTAKNVAVFVLNPSVSEPCGTIPPHGLFAAGRLKGELRPVRIVRPVPHPTHCFLMRWWCRHPQRGSRGHPPCSSFFSSFSFSGERKTDRL